MEATSPILRACVIVPAGAAIGGVLFSLIGEINHNYLVSVRIGVACGAVVAIGVLLKLIGADIVVGILAAVGFAILGPSVDDYSGMMALPGFFVGYALSLGGRKAYRLGLESGRALE